MKKIRQKTIANKVEFEGKGLHSGKDVKIEFLPADEDTGILFVRKDIKENNVIKVCPESIDTSSRRTVLTNGNISVHTIEHLLSVLHGYRITNLVINLDSYELPAGDGSAKVYVDLIKKAGIKEQDKEVDPIYIDTPVSVNDENSSIVLFPQKDKLTIEYTLDYSEFGVPVQYLKIDITEEKFEQELGAIKVFEKELSQARTFCMKAEVQELLSKGIGQGASYENTLVIEKGGTPINNQLRYPDELVRHKILDLLGDLYLLGRPIYGKIVAVKSGHTMNVKLVKEIANIIKKKSIKPISIQKIFDILPHRFPFLLVDRLIEVEYMKKAVGIKNVTINEWFFQGHFPGQPIMPGVLQIEAMAQVAGAILLSLENRGKVIPVFMSITDVKFRKPVIPGDQLIIHTELLHVRGKMGEVQGKVFVDGKLVSEAKFRFMLSKKG